MPTPDEPRPRRRRRAVGPPGARPVTEPEPRAEPVDPPPSAGDDERFLRDRPPHHDRER